MPSEMDELRQDSEAPRKPLSRPGIGVPALMALVLVGVALIAALFEGHEAAQATSALALAALALGTISLVRGERRAWPAIPLAVIAALIALPELRALPAPDAPLERATRRLEEAWSAAIAELDGALANPSPAGGDFSWLRSRVPELGPRAGVAVLARRTGRAVAWAGWTTPLSELELAEIEARLTEGPVLLALRRGLELRLVRVRTYEGAPELMLAAERPLPREPEAGFLARGLGREVKLRVRWEALGEGIRGEIGLEDEDSAVRLWSLVPLMAEETTLARVTLGLAPESARRSAQELRRHRIAALLGAALLVTLALRRRPLRGLLLLPARAILLFGGPWPELLGATDFGQPLDIGGPLPRLLGPVFARLIDTPVDIALTVLCLVGVAALLPVPQGKGGRRALIGGGLALALAGLALTAWITLETAASPGEGLLPSATQPTQLALLLLLGALPWSGLIIASRGVGYAGGRAWLAVALLAGLVSGLVHARSLAPAGRALAERHWAPELEKRTALWEQSLLATLEIAAPRVDNELVRERDAIDLWWNSPLGERGLASGVWKYDTAGRLEDSFLSGIAPIDPESSLAGFDEDVVSPYPRRFLSPESFRFEFVEGSFRLRLAEVRRVDGGAWVAAVLEEPGNIPSRQHGDPLRGARAAAGSSRRRNELDAFEPHLAWFDRSGELISSDLAAGPPAPLTPPATKRWRDATIDGRDALVLELPDANGTVSFVLFPPEALDEAAIAIGWGLVLGLLALMLYGVNEIAHAPRSFATSFVRRLRATVRRFGAQLGLALLFAGLVPLLALAWAGHTAVRAEAREQLAADGARSARVARRFVEDYFALDGNRTLTTRGGDRLASWVSRTLGDDLYLWEGGELRATSRTDLVRAGLWPRRLAGETWNALNADRQPVVIERFELAVGRRAQARTVVHGPFRTNDGSLAALSLPLRRAGLRARASLVAYDRALLVGAALILAMIAGVLVPLTRRFVRPLADLERATTELAGGRFDAEVPETGYEETRALARAFRAMAGSLATQRESLERRRAAIETIINSVPLAVVALTPDERVWATNARGEELLDAHAEETLSPPAGPLGDALDAAKRAKGRSVTAIDTDEGKQPRHFRISALDLPGLAEGGALRLLMVEDLTDTVRSERLTAWAEMARRIAHEIKNPLTPISLVVEHVRRLADKRDPRLEETLDRCLGTISEQVEVLKETAREFNDYARLIRARPEELDLGERVATWLEPYVVAAPAGVVVEAEALDALPVMRLDPRLLRRAVVNLVENALAASEDGGRVLVRGRVETRGDDEEVVIEVIDEGPGIPPEKLGQLFEPDVTTRETGTGLGLPIALQAVEAHDGRIEVDSTPGQGARFTIHLPRGSAAAPGEEGQA